MNNKTDYHPFKTSTDLHDTRSYLPERFKHALLEQERSLRDGTKFKKGSVVYAKGDYFGYFSHELENTIIMVEGHLHEILYKFGEGGEGKIKVLKRLSDGAIILDKIFLEQLTVPKWERRLDELGLLADAGLSRGYTKRVWRKKTNGVPQGPYRLKHHALTPYLGRNLNSELKEQEELAKYNPQQNPLEDEKLKAARVKIAVELCARIHFLQSGALFISNKGIVHHDLKPDNIILSEDGLWIIDYGLAERGADEIVYLFGGTAGYYMFSPFNLNDDDDEYNKASGRCIDNEALQRILNAKLCDDPPANNYTGRYNRYGIFPPELIKEYGLEIIFANKGYITDKMRYAKPDELKIINPMTKAAVILCGQLKLSDDDKKRVMDDELLALCIVGAYFSNQNDWLKNGRDIIQAISNLSKKEKELRAEFIEFDLLEHLDKALKNPLMCEVLKSKATPEMKRVIVGLFKLGLIFSNKKCTRLEDDKVYKLLSKNQEIIPLCIELLVKKDNPRLNQVLFRDDVVRAYKVYAKHSNSQPSNFYYFLDNPTSLPLLENAVSASQIALLRGCITANFPYNSSMKAGQMRSILSNPRALEIWLWAKQEKMNLKKLEPFLLQPNMTECFDLLAAFPLTPQDVLIMQKESATINWLYLKLMTKKSANTTRHELLELSVVLHTFVTNPIYRKAILFIANSSFVEEDIDNLLSALIGRSSNLEVLIQEATTMTDLADKLSLSSLTYIYRKNLSTDNICILVKSHPELFKKDQEQSGFLDVLYYHHALPSRLNNIKINFSPVGIERFFFEIPRVNQDLFRNIMMKSTSLLNYFLSAKSIAPYVLEKGKEAHKVRFIEFCLLNVSSETFAHKLLATDDFIKAGIVLINLGLLDKDNLEIIATNPNFCKEIASYIDNNLNNEHQLIFKWKFAHISIGADSQNLENTYPNIKTLIIETKDHIPNQSTRKQLNKKWLELYQALDSIKQIFNNEASGEYSAAHDSFNQMLTNIDICFNSTPSSRPEELANNNFTNKVLFKKRITCILRILSEFLPGENIAKTIQDIELKQVTKETARWNFFQTPENEEPKPLRDLRCLVKNIRELMPESDMLGFHALKTKDRNQAPATRNNMPVFASA
jgi:serine/threonine protein kinase